MRLLNIIFLLTVGVSMNAYSQAITLDTLPKNTYCIGDTITIKYHATGFFKPDNVFVLQLSDVNGLFGNFSIVARDTTRSGSMVFQTSQTGTMYHFRVASTDPYIVSADNGKNLSIEGPPAP